MGCSAGKADEQPQLTRWYTNMLQRRFTPECLEGEFRTRYLPRQVRGFDVLIKDGDSSFRVDNSELQDRAQGLCYRLSKDIEDKDFEHVAFWNTLVVGKEDGDGWIVCDLDREKLDLLDQMGKETFLEAVRCKFSGRVMVASSSSSNVDGKWVSKARPGPKTILGTQIQDGHLTLALAWEGLNRFSIQAGEKRSARLVEDRLIWSDGDVWTRDTQDLDMLKQTDKHGDDLDSADACFLSMCHKGLKPGSSNQDAWTVLRAEGEFSLYMVCDGHGPHGHDVANFVKDILPRVMLKDPRFPRASAASMLDAFRLTHALVDSADAYDRLDARWSGTTATAVIHDHRSGKLFAAHVGDSTAVVGGYVGKEVKATQLTRDHKPDLCDERDRIVAWGGRIDFDGYADFRIYNKDGYGAGLNMTRSLGDLASHRECGLIADPEVREYAVMPDDQVLLLCSDGIWEFMTPQEAVELVLQQSSASDALNGLISEARRRWVERAEYIDDIVAIVVYLNAAHETKQRGLCATIAGGGA